LIHFTTVPSVMVSVCWGMVMGEGMGAPGQNEE
jgi:hypothetical protein